MKRLIALLALLVTPSLYSAGSLSGSQTCPTSGVKALNTTVAQAVAWVQINAPSANTGTIYVGGSNVSTTTGTPVVASGAMFMPPLSNSRSYTMSGIYFACSASGDSVTWTALQ